MLMPKCSLLIERPARAAASSMTMRPAAASWGVHSEGSHPSDSRPQRSRAAGMVPPSHTSSGCCTGSGESLTSRKLPTPPSWLTVSPAHSRRSSGSASSMAAPRRLGSTPMTSRSGGYVSPGTSVTSSRPRHSTSRLASCLARRGTLRPGNSIVVPSFTRGLLAAAQARPTAGSSTGPVSTSESQRESNPSSSSPVTSSASASGVDAPPAVPTPIRIFMSDDLEPLEPHRVIGLVPVEHPPDRRLLLARHHHLVDPLEVDADALALVLERLREHRLELVADPPRVGDLDGSRGVIDAREKPHQQRTEHLSRRLERLHEPQREGDPARGLARRESRGDAIDVVGHLRDTGGARVRVVAHVSDAREHAPVLLRQEVVGLQHLLAQRHVGGRRLTDRLRVHPDPARLDLPATDQRAQPLGEVGRRPVELHQPGLDVA